METSNQTVSAMQSLPTGRSSSERCPGNLCAHVSSPLFDHWSPEQDTDSLLHDVCDNCSSIADREPLCAFCSHLRLHHLAICLENKLKRLNIELDLDRNTRGSGISRIFSTEGCVLCSLIAQTIHSYFVMSKKPDEDENNMKANTGLSCLLDQSWGIGRLTLNFTMHNTSHEVEIMYRKASEGTLNLAAHNTSHEVEITPEPTLKLTAYNTFREVEAMYRKASKGPKQMIEGRINWRTVQQWIRECTQHPKCTRSELSPIPQGFRLFDVNNRKLISDFQPGSKLGGNIKFVALSYVWGKLDISSNDALLSSNKHELTTNGLGKMNLPKAIEDAITVCQQLDQRFLWVDRLCIQQDGNEREKRAQINAMGDIYSSTEFTIIHASGTSMEDPIPGVSTTREVFQSKTVVCGLELMSGYPDLKVIMLQSKWNERGWTYQEAVLSRRKLLFTPFELWFECNDEHSPYQREEQCTRRRDGWFISRSQMSQLGQYRLNSFVERTTRFEDFLRHIESYTARSLTYQSDILDAFVGILTTLYEGNRGIYGLPEVDFDRALLWYCENNPIKKMDTISVPSWSWASVSGTATTPMLRWHYPGFLGTLIQWSYKDQNGKLKTVRSENGLQPEQSDANAQGHLLVAWWEGCIEPEVSEDVEQELQKLFPACRTGRPPQLPFINRVLRHIRKAESCGICEKRIAQRWPCLEDVWKDIQKARNSGLWETQYLTMSPQKQDQLLIEKLHPGVLLTRAQIACFKLSMAEWERRALDDSDSRLHLVNSQRQRIGIIWPAYLDALREVVDVEPEALQVDSLQCIGISLSRSDYGRPRQPVVNVLAIRHKEGSPFARRIGVGYVNFADWIKVDRTFKTIGLE
ncbi:HET-domain-containing protein [Xylaria curta]|nr:HET-domain-containing protein [Xylaria curta]